jgi:hypothetical protein
MPVQYVQLPPLHVNQQKIAADPHRFRIAATGRQWGKALSIDTPIPTSSGWKTMRDIQVGDQIYDENGNYTTVTFVTEIMLNHKCWELTFSDGSTIVADDEHLWVTHNKAYRKAIGGRQTLPSQPEPITTGEIAKTLKYAKENNHAIPVCLPLDGEDRDILVDPYLLGLWLGDGSANGTEITTADPEVVQAFIDAGYVMRKKVSDPNGWLIGDGIKHRRKNGRIFRSPESFSGKLEALGLIQNKHIPRQYLRASFHTRLALLQGLMDSDGYADNDGSCEFCNTNHLLSEQFYELVCSIGIKARFHASDAKLYGRVVSRKYRIHFSTQYPVFRLRRKLERIQKCHGTRDLMYRYIVDAKEVPSVPVKCITVDSQSHLYLAGKSFIPTHNTLLAAEELIVRANAGQACWWVFPTFKMTAPGMRYLNMMLKDFPGIYFSKKDLIWIFESGGRIELRSANEPDGLRGDTLDFVVLDEAAYIPREAWEAAISPMIGVRKGAALFFSTFWGRNWFWELYQFAESGKSDDWKAFHFTSYDNPYYDDSEIDAAKARLPHEVFAQEYLGQPMDENALVFSGIKSAAVLQPEETPVRGRTYVAGLDWANNQDYSVCIIGDASSTPVRQVHMYRFNQTGWEVQWGWLKNILNFWNPALVVAESNAVGDANIAALRKMGVKNLVPFYASWISKRLLIESWKLAIEQRGCLLLRNDDIINEHMAYEAQITEGGMIKYNAPRGMNDDTVIASALMWHGASGAATSGSIIRQKVNGLWGGKRREYPLWGGRTGRTAPTPR